jgi:alpha-1,2-glucosyltransferase
MPKIQYLVFLICLTYPLYTAWQYKVNEEVQLPYLDEIFHVRQAQAYCEGRFRTWDPKITTPPGLYLLSYLLLKGRDLIQDAVDCDLVNLRWVNSLVAVFLIPSQLFNLYTQLGPARHGHHLGNSLHAVLNICYFPLLFFFSGLYYTDVWSVYFVLSSYGQHVRFLQDGRRLDQIKMFVLGFCALLMRQTNIFWVAIFLTGLHAVHHLKKVDRPHSGKSMDIHNVLDEIYDPLVSEAYLEGMIS